MRSQGLLISTFLIISAWPITKTRAAEETFESIYKKSVPIYNLKEVLLPFVATCDQEKERFRHMFCTALNERLKAQHQNKIYRLTLEPKDTGPLIVAFKERPAPTLEISVKGCLTCNQPMLEHQGGDISKGRFFLFKLPKDITIRRGPNPYDFGNIQISSYKVDLPKGMTEKKFKEELLPNLRLDLLFRPVAGVTTVGKRHKYGVINFELLAHRVYHKCQSVVYGASPAMAGSYIVDKNDLSCPQNQKKKIVAKPKLPSTLPQQKVKDLMEALSDDLQVCYEQFGVLGQVPMDIVISPVGKVKQARALGSLAGTPTAKCVERLVKNMAFPQFEGEDSRLQWPFTLRQ